MHPHYSARYLCGSLPVPARPDSEAVSFKWNKILYGERVHFSSRSDTLCHLSQQEEKEIALSGYYFYINQAEKGCYKSVFRSVWFWVFLISTFLLAATTIQKL